MSGISLILLAATVIARPNEGAKMPFMEMCGIYGSTTPGVTNIVIAGKSVPVSHTGAWATAVPVVEGTNTIYVGETNVTVVIGKKPKPSKGPQKPGKTYTKLPYAADKPQEPPTNKAPSEILFVLDAGHGGEDPGALSPHLDEEKDANLMTTLLVQEELVSRGYQVVLTRDDDTFIPLYDRPKVAHQKKADAFISIHHNAAPLDKDPSVLRYTTVYAWNSLGAALAKAIDIRLGAALAPLKNNGVMMGNLAVTRNPEIPSCLVEVDFVSSPEGEEAIWNPERREKVARAIADGLVDWTKGAKK